MGPAFLPRNRLLQTGLAPPSPYSASGNGGGPSLEGPTPEPISTPKPPSRNSSDAKKAAKGFSLETLGSDLYLPGEVSS